MKPYPRSTAEYRAAAALVGEGCDCREWQANGFGDEPCMTCCVAAALRAAHDAGRRGTVLTARVVKAIEGRKR